MRKTLVTNLKDYEDPVQSQFGKNCRKSTQSSCINMFVREQTSIKVTWM